MLKVYCKTSILIYSVISFLHMSVQYHQFFLFVALTLIIYIHPLPDLTKGNPFPTYHAWRLTHKPHCTICRLNKPHWCNGDGVLWVGPMAAGDCGLPHPHPPCSFTHNRHSYSDPPVTHFSICVCTSGTCDVLPHLHTEHCLVSDNAKCSYCRAPHI